MTRVALNDRTSISDFAGSPDDNRFKPGELMDFEMPPAIWVAATKHGRTMQ